MNRILKKLVSAVALGLTVCLFSASLCSAVAAAAEPTQERTISTQQYDGPNGRFKVYLSPSAQPWNPYCDGSGSEVAMSYLVDGYFPGGLDAVRGDVDAVLAHQVERLRAYVDAK